MSEEKASYEGRQPTRDKRIARYLETLPRGIQLHAEFMRSLEDGLLYPGVAIRSWLDIASKTDDGRDISGSKSAWTCDAFTTSRQYASILTAALRRTHPETHYEVWAVAPSRSESGPRIIDYEPDLSSREAFHGKIGRYTNISEQDVRSFARDYVIDYYKLHESNHRFLEILSCGPHQHHHTNWACKVNFSQSGDMVTLLIHPTTKGLEVFVHEYED